VKPNISLHQKLFKDMYLTVIISVILISLTASVFSVFNASSHITDSLQKLTSQKIDNIEVNLDIIENNIRSIVFNPQLQDYLLRYNSGFYPNKTELKIEVNQLVQNLTRFFPQTENLLVYAQDGELVGSLFEVDGNQNIASYPWFTEAVESQGATIWMTDYGRVQERNDNKNFISHTYKKIKNFRLRNDVKLGDEIGSFVIEYNFDSISELLKNPDASTAIFVLNQDGTILSSNEKNLIGSQSDLLDFLEIGQSKIVRRNKQKQIIFSNRIFTTDEIWYCVSVIPYSTIFADAKMIIIISLLLALLILIISFGVSWKNANSISLVFQEMHNKFGLIESGKKDVKLESTSNITEINQLINHFNQMAARLDQLIYEVFNSELKKEQITSEMKEAKLQALQMQINPHFLYNTLDTINWTALMQGNKDVSKMVLALGELFRSNVDMTEIMTTIQKEVKRVELYLFLEKIRFGEKIDWEINVQENLLENEIICFLLQPLVENSIIHGLEPNRYNGKITIDISQAGKDIQISVKDNGSGISADKQQNLQDMWLAIKNHTIDASHENGNVGLRNIMKRLILIYDTDANFVISSADTGTTIQIKYPAINNNAIYKR
jgi:two-component system sensor histidine kinase YesM